jgi:hypothetical protein
MATKQKSKPAKRPEKQSNTPADIKTRSASTQPGRWHTGGGGTKSRSYVGK